MEKIRFLNNQNVYDGEVYVSGNIAKIKYHHAYPSQDIMENGFELLNENNGLVQGEYPTYTTIYRTYENDPMLVELSNDGSVYVAPPEPRPYMPTEEEIAEQ